MLHPISTSVQYNRSSRQWFCTVGSFSHSFPSGNAGKRAAQLCYLQRTAPDIYAEVCAILHANQANPEYLGLKNRVIDAGLLVCVGAVKPADGYRADQLNSFAIVASQAENERPYHIHANRYPLECECDAFHFRPITIGGCMPACKHTLAYVISQAVAEREQAEAQEYEQDRQAIKAAKATKLQLVK